MSEEAQKKVFERFFKVDEFAQGTGLGLSICQTIAERLDGRITLSSQEGKGSRFTLIILAGRNKKGGPSQPEPPSKHFTMKVTSFQLPSIWYCPCHIKRFY